MFHHWEQFLLLQAHHEMILKFIRWYHECTSLQLQQELTDRRLPLVAVNGCGMVCLEESAYLSVVSKSRPLGFFLSKVFQRWKIFCTFWFGLNIRAHWDVLLPQSISAFLSMFFSLFISGWKLSIVGKMYISVLHGEWCRRLIACRTAAQGALHKLLSKSKLRRNQDVGVCFVEREKWWHREILLITKYRHFCPTDSHF